ncbi:unnamed protein product [Linum tenue]|uniref:RNase H type-1 domain-containing protein n=1 Tax=Linum tenue TaxID=586396 RepID=A0AAV0JUK2_9ROSI|nr:unnamed protein product [Linum tenue]
MPHSSILAAELQAIRDGLSLVWTLGYRDVRLETDSQLAVSLIHSRDPTFHHLGSLISDCRSLIQHRWNCTIHHIFREANGVADMMARQGHTHPPGERLWTIPPLSVCRLVQMECGFTS